MKKGKFAAALFVVLLLASGLSGCAHSSDSTEASVQSSPGYKSIFKLKLYSDKSLYQTNEKIKIWATLMYTGENDQIEIWHADPYISFTITDGGTFSTGGMSDLVLMQTTLDKGKLYRFDYQKWGGYDENDLNEPFWKQFYADPDLRLPPGHYTVKVHGAFYLDRKYAYLFNDLDEEVQITVG